MAGYRELRTELDEIGPQMQRAAWARPALDNPFICATRPVLAYSRVTLSLR